MSSVNSDADTDLTAAAESRSSALIKRNISSQSFHTDDMSLLLENVYGLHQKISNESSQLKLQYSELVSVNQELLDKNQYLQKQCDHLLNENETLKEELTRLKLRLCNRELVETDTCCIKGQSPEELNHVEQQKRKFQSNLLDAEHEIEDRCQSKADFNQRLLFSSTEACDLRALDTSHVSSAKHINVPDTNCSYFSESHPKSKTNKTIQRPNIVIPETVAMDCSEKESDFLEMADIESKDCKVTKQMSDMLEVEMENLPLESELVSEQTLEPAPDINSVVQTFLEPVMSDEPGSPVFDRFREVKSVRKKSLESPSLFDEDDDCCLHSVRKSSGNCLGTPVRGSVVIQKHKMENPRASFKNEICLNDPKRINFLDETLAEPDSINCSSPSVISGGMEIHISKENAVIGEQADFGSYSKQCQNNGKSDVVSHVKTSALTSAVNTSVLLEQRQCTSDNDITPGVYQKRLSRFSLKKIDKTDAKENRFVSDAQKSTELTSSFCRNRRKRKRPSDPDETFCPFDVSVLENSACDSTHYIAPRESMFENSVTESTHFVEPRETMLENSMPAICNLDSVATTNINSKTLPDVQLTESELEREIVSCSPAPHPHESGCIKTLASPENEHQHSEDSFQIKNRMMRDSNVDSYRHKSKHECIMELGENVDHIAVCDASTAVKIKLDIPLFDVPGIESPAQSQASQCLLGHPSNFTLPAHKSLQLDQLKDRAPADREGIRDMSVHLRPTEMEDSFDRVPKAETIGYAYVDVVRKQHQRRQLDGYACVQCEQWYQGLDLTDEQIKERLKTCRHKARFQPSSTPEHYWSIGFPDTQQCKERGYLHVGPVSPSKHRRKKGLRLLFESKKEQLKEQKRKQQSLEQCLKLCNQRPSFSK